MRKFLKKICFLFLTVVAFSTAVVNTSFAIVDITRDANYSVIGSDGKQEFSTSMPNLNILPYFNDDGGDLSIELSNPFCLAYTAAFFAAWYAGNAEVRLTAVASLIAGSMTIYAVAQDKFKDFEICGADWLVWGSSNKAATEDIEKYYPELSDFNGSIKRSVLNCIKDRSKCDTITKNFMGTRDTFDMRDKVFRERVYDGEEVINNNCKDPRDERGTYDVSGTGQLYYMRGFAQGNYACDRFLNPDNTNKTSEFEDAYNCCVEASRSVCITDKKGADRDTRSAKNFFCGIDDGLCDYSAFIFQIFKSEEGEKGIYCARTWSLCPYNFNIEKGSEKSSYFDKTITEKSVADEAEDFFSINGSNYVVDDPCFDSSSGKALSCSGKRKNFYQYRRHCTVVEKWIQPDEYDDIDYAPFIDKSCINFVGSSHNTIGYKSYDGYYKLFDQYKSFTAPIAECIAETLKNFLYNRAGHDKCLKTNSLPDTAGNCENGFEYQVGDDLLETQGIIDPISRLLSYIDSLLKLTLMIMVVLYGYNILISGGKLDKKDLIIMLIKVAVVLAFASSIWWRQQLFNFVYGFSESFSNLTSKLAFDDTLDSELNLVKYDGCYFGDINDVLGKGVGDDIPNIEDNNYYNYPSSRQYIAVFDALDCKISKYLGYSVGKDIPNLLFVIGASLIWPFNIGIFLAVASLMMLLFVISFAIRAVYIFVAASIGLAIMLYISPIVIPCILFKSRKKMFDAWVKYTISYALQPLFLFAFVSIALTIMDSYVLGEGIFVGNGPQRELVCGYVCKGTDSGDIVSYGDDLSDADCGDDETLIDTKRKSVLCLLEKATATPWTVFNSIGIFISLLSDLQLADLIMFLRIAFLFFILNKVLTSIPTIASNITGTNSGIPNLLDKTGDPFAMATKIKDFGGIAQRIFKYTGISAGKTGVSAAKQLGNKILNNKKSSGDDKESEDDGDKGSKGDSKK